MKACKIGWWTTMGKGRRWRETPETAEWQLWWLRLWKTAAADNDGDGGRGRRQMTMAREIGRRTMTGKDKSRRRETAETAEWR
jgi:hypothetical protein